MLNVRLSDALVLGIHCVFYSSGVVDVFGQVSCLRVHVAPRVCCEVWVHCCPRGVLRLSLKRVLLMLSHILPHLVAAHRRVGPRVRALGNENLRLVVLRPPSILMTVHSELFPLVLDLYLLQDHLVIFLSRVGRAVVFAQDQALGALLVRVETIDRPH